MMSCTILTCVVALVVCARCTIPAPPVRFVQSVQATAPPGERFLQYFAYLRALPPEALHREHARQDTAFTEHPSAENRLRLVLLLSLPATDFENRRYALELLQQYLQAPESSESDFVDIAALLATFVRETQRTQRDDPLLAHLQAEIHEKERLLVAQQQRAKKLQDEAEAQRALHNNLNRQLQEAVNEKDRQLAMQQQLNRKLQEERRNVKKLQEKIEKIKDIEKSLMDRERTDNKGT
jgi:DNA repair exonuclease SbcCD ATPase subunit